MATTTKRSDYLSWPDYFMATAFLAAQRSKDPSCQVGAVIVNAAHRIVGCGYNGFPRGCSDDEFPWAKAGPDPMQLKYMYVCHAEVNAVLNKNAADVTGCTLYVALFPCNECAKIIIQSGIRRVVYLSDKHRHKPETQAAKRMFDACRVECNRYVPSMRRIVLDFALEAGDLELEMGRLSVGTAPSTPADRGSSAGSSSPASPNSPVGKRENYLSWSEYFMAVALLSAQRSKDPSTQVGACIVNASQQIVAIGYNGFPLGCSDDVFPWSRAAPVAPLPTEPLSPTQQPYSEPELQSKYLYVCHAEVNAVLNRNAGDVSRCTIYVTLFPCNECAKLIIQSGIERVVYLSDKYATTVSTKAAKRMFEAAAVRWERFSVDDGFDAQRRVVIDFDDIDRRNYSQLPATPTMQ